MPKVNKINKQARSYNITKKNPDNNSFDMLKRAWEDLPTDFTMGERTLFIEIAERLVKATSDNNRRLN